MRSYVSAAPFTRRPYVTKYCIIIIIIIIINIIIIIIIIIIMFRMD